MDKEHLIDLISNSIISEIKDLEINEEKFIANRRLTQLGLDEEFTGVSNPFPWMSEIIDLRKEKNFFETRVTEYQVGGALNWE